MNPNAEGTTYAGVPFVVDPARVDAFRRIFAQPGGVPPTFLTAAEFTVLPSVISDPALGLDFGRVVHGSQEYVFHRPLVEGETLVVRARIESIRVRAGTGFLTVVMEMVGGDDEVAATARSQMIERADDAG